MPAFDFTADAVRDNVTFGRSCEHPLVRALSRVEDDELARAIAVHSPELPEIYRDVPASPSGDHPAFSWWDSACEAIATWAVTHIHGIDLDDISDLDDGEFNDR